jgi:hypothetical protein
LAVENLRDRLSNRRPAFFAFTVTYVVDDVYKEEVKALVGSGGGMVVV